MIPFDKFGGRGHERFERRLSDWLDTRMVYFGCHGDVVIGTIP
jgi:hypothetical protein